MAVEAQRTQRDTENRAQLGREQGRGEGGRQTEKGARGRGGKNFKKEVEKAGPGKFEMQTEQTQDQAGGGGQARKLESPKLLLAQPGDGHSLRGNPPGSSTPHSRPEVTST